MGLVGQRQDTASLRIGFSRFADYTIDLKPVESRCELKRARPAEGQPTIRPRSGWAAQQWSQHSTMPNVLSNVSREGAGQGLVKKGEDQRMMKLLNSFLVLFFFQLFYKNKMKLEKLINTG